MEFGAFILCGGKSSRMGEDKGLIPFLNSPMIEHTINALNLRQVPITLITSNNDYNQFGLDMIADSYTDKGPLAGIHAGLLHSKYNVNIVLSCDTPLIPTALIQHLIESYNDDDALIVSIDGRAHPLIGIYHKRIIPELEALIKEENLRLSQLHERIKTRTLDLTDHSIFGNQHFYANMNRMEELKEVEDSIDVRFFGMIAEKLGMTSTKISLKVVHETKVLRPLLESYFPALESFSYLIAVDHTIKEEVAADDQIIEISILPPFAGG